MANVHTNERMWLGKRQAFYKKRLNKNNEPQERELLFDHEMSDENIIYEVNKKIKKHRGGEIRGNKEVVDRKNWERYKQQDNNNQIIFCCNRKPK